jgi:hypothetical protein
MADKLDALLDLIRQERDRQRSLPGAEFDVKNSVNDWVAIASHYLSEPAKRKGPTSHWGGVSVSKADYEDSLIKAAAVIVAALEHSETLKKSGGLS